jgi:hypothetical protein
VTSRPCACRCSARLSTGEGSFAALLLYSLPRTLTYERSPLHHLQLWLVRPNVWYRTLTAEALCWYFATIAAAEECDQYALDEEQT